MGHGVRLVAHEHALAWRAVRFPAVRAKLKRIADDALDTFARVHVFLDGDFVGRALLENTTQVAVDALGVFADHDEVYVFRLDAFQRAEPGVEQTHRAHVRVQVHPAAHAKQNFARMNVRRHARIAECTHEDRVEIARQHGKSICRDGCLVGEVAVCAPVERGELDRRACRADCADSLLDDFFADAVAGNNRNALLGNHAGQGSRERSRVSGLCKSTVSGKALGALGTAKAGRREGDWHARPFAIIKKGLGAKVLGFSLRPDT